jgi:hypothetical protein
VTKKVLYYVSGHGYGHATRAGEVIREVANSRPGWAIHVTTTAGERFFPVGPTVRLRRPADEIDVGVAELDPLTVDATATLTRVQALHRNRDRIVAAEASFVRREGIDLIVADIPWLAGYVAEAGGVPCLGVGNFTWDWIYEPYLTDDARWAPLLEWVRGGYARMGTYLRLPFGHAVSGFRQVVEVPLVARRRGTDRVTARRALQVGPGETRRLVLLGMRGTAQRGYRDAAAQAGPDYLFVCPETALGPRPGNVLPAGPETGLGFPDLLTACDVVVGKLGYGLLAEAVTAGTAILYPPRAGFREDDLLRAAAGQYARARAIPLADFRAGRWSPHLEELLAMHPPPLSLEPRGAGACAAEIVRRTER